MIHLFGAIMAMILGISLINKETLEKTADFLLTRPITRNQILMEKISAALIIIVMTNLIILLVSSVTAQMVATSSFHLGQFIMITISLFFVQIIFFTMGLAISMVSKKIKSHLSISLGVVFGFYALAAFGNTTKDEPLRYLTPLKYFDPYNIIETNHYELSFGLVSIFLVLILTSTCFYIFNKKDIHTV
jgi:ABC-2 type transport system permease protein